VGFSILLVHQSKPRFAPAVTSIYNRKLNQSPVVAGSQSIEGKAQSFGTEPPGACRAAIRTWLFLSPKILTLPRDDMYYLGKYSLGVLHEPWTKNFSVGGFRVLLGMLHAFVTVDFLASQ